MPLLLDKPDFNSGLTVNAVVGVSDNAVDTGVAYPFDKTGGASGATAQIYKDSATTYVSLRSDRRHLDNYNSESRVSDRWDG